VSDQAQKIPALLATVAGCVDSPAKLARKLKKFLQSWSVFNN